MSRTAAPRASLPAAADPGPPPKLQRSDIPQFRDKDARIKTLDKQGLQACIMLPSFGIAFEADCIDDPEAMLANMRAFNRFVEDDWGYHYQERTITPVIVQVARIYRSAHH